jgi:hypothetical protein
MSKQELCDSEIKSTCSDDGIKQLFGFFALLFKVYCRTQKSETEKLKQPNWDDQNS